MRTLGRARLTVDPDRFVLAVLRDFLPDSVTVERTRTDDFLDSLPWVQPRALPGGDPGRNLRFRSVANVAVETWAAEATQASDLADQVTQAFLAAWESQHVYLAPDDTPIGGLARFQVTAEPGELRDAGQLGRVVHWTASYTLTLRPASVL